MHRNRRPVRPLIVLVCLVLAVLAPRGAAGELEPPGPPGPTMKPLPDLEPRRPIVTEMMPLTITEPGSYYLLGDVDATTGGITIAADDVTIDLMGFTIHDAPGACIRIDQAMAPPPSGMTIRNGTVRGCGGHGLRLSSSQGYDVHAVVSDVVAIGNVTIGIDVGGSSRVADCTAVENGAEGIYAYYASVVERCVVRLNGGNGIGALQGVQILDSSVWQNTGNGIAVGYDCLVRGNDVAANGWGATGKAGILTSGSGNRIEDNHINNSDYGIKLEYDSNVVIRNTIRGSPSIDAVAGNLIGPEVTSLTSAGPWANILY